MIYAESYKHVMCTNYLRHASVMLVLGGGGGGGAPPEVLV